MDSGPDTLANFHTLDPTRVEELNRLHGVIQGLRQEDREQRRYGAAAEQSEPCLCVPVDYGTTDLSHIPERVLEVDYGCGDPTQYAAEGEKVLDLGSGSGKHCFMLAQKVGPRGRVIGIDKTPNMLALSRGAVDEVMGALGYPAPMVEFRRGDIENLDWDLDRLEGLVAAGGIAGYPELERIADTLAEAPMIPDQSVDLVVSNCVLNLVADGGKPRLFQELHRVLRKGGRAVISDIVAEDHVPEHMKADEDLWTGCLSGALRRDRFLQSFADAGFYGIQELSSFFWQRQGGVNFHSVTVVAYKGKEGPCWETYRQALYRGPFSAAHDDDGHVYPRGVAVPVCEKTANILSRPPYQEHFLVTDAVGSEDDQIPFDCSEPIARERRDLPSSIRKASINLQVW